MQHGCSVLQCANQLVEGLICLCYALHCGTMLLYVQVEAVEMLASTAFCSCWSWADRRDSDVVGGVTTLAEELDNAKTVLVPVTHLRTDNGQDGPQTAGVCCAT
jgi:hypothetical protein